jgi:hypothetical protein
MPLRNKIAPGYTIYLMMYENDYRKWSMLTWFYKYINT